MKASGGDSDIAADMVNQRASDVKDEQRREADDRAESDREAKRKTKQPGWMESNIHRNTSIVNDNYRGMASDAMSQVSPWAGKLVDAMGRLTDSIIARGEALRGFSPSLAYAGAVGDIRRQRSDFYEAQVAGPAYGRVMNEESKLESTLRDAFAPVKASIADGVADVLVVLGDIVNQFLPLIKVIEATVRFTFDVLKTILAVIQFAVEKSGLKDLIDAIGDFFTNKDKAEAKGLDLEKIFKNPLLEFPQGQWMGPGAPPRDGRGLGIPIVEGL